MKEVHSIGNKAKNLRLLSEAAFRVPPFIVVANDITEESLSNALTRYLKNTKFFAVRSSAEAEDSGKISMAGHFYSAVGIKRKDVFTEYRKVVHSFDGKPGSVIIQVFIPTRIAGVMFTDNMSGHIVVNSNFGLCKTVVEGGKCDEFVIDMSGKLSFSEIATKKVVLSFISGSTEDSYSDKCSLNSKELRMLAKVGEKIEAYFGRPQDIEWGFHRNKLYILQSRPVTRSFPIPKAKTYYDSANIAESYSGIVLPLTLSFARHIYAVVYKNLLKASGVPKRKLNAHEDVFQNMLSWFSGRLYYNMNSWYKMMSFVPGYKRNKVNLENMITSNIRSEVDRSILPGILFKLTYPILVIAKLIFFKSYQNGFSKKVKSVLKEFRSLNLLEYNMEQCLALYKKYDKELISKWHIPVENDFLVMTYFGLLKKKLGEQELSKTIKFNSKTGDQIRSLIDLRESLASEKQVSSALDENDFLTFNKYLGENSEARALLDAYFIEYGGRFASELKLESPDIEEDRMALFQLLRLCGNLTKHENQKDDSQRHPFFIRFLAHQFRKYAAQREEMRLRRSNGFSIIRKIVQRMGTLMAEENQLENADDIFYLEIEELLGSCKSFRTIIQKRKIEYKAFEQNEPPPYFSLEKGQEPHSTGKPTESENFMQGRACTSGVVTGKVSIFKEFKLPDTPKVEILVAKHTDPGWTPLIGICKGMIIEHGGILSHAAIVSRELGIPTVIGVNGATDRLKDDQLVEVNGNTGSIHFLK